MVPKMPQDQSPSLEFVLAQWPQSMGMGTGTMMQQTVHFDRAAEDVGNLVHLEHVNLTVPDQRSATIFYVSGLGLTRDPYLMTGVDNMWVNMGASQFHLPTGAPQRLRGTIGLVIPDREGLLRRLSQVASMLADTQFGVDDRGEFVAVTCPWGNHIRCHAHQPDAFGGMKLGLPYVEFPVEPGRARSIAEFYRTVLGAPSTVAASGEADLSVARVAAGFAQTLVFRETREPLAPYDGHHIQVYAHDFSGAHARLLERGLVSEESDQHQFRFTRIVDLEQGTDCFQLEHEVRSMRHPLYRRPLVNRNSGQTNRNYRPGEDSFR